MKNLNEIPNNEPVLEYKPKSKEKVELKKKIYINLSTCLGSLMTD